MPAALTSREEIVDRLFTVFRDRGFEGASLAELSQATGLGRSSLYHYFPGGKEQMAETVLAHAADTVKTQMLHAAQAAEPLSVRVRRITSVLETMYAGGRTPCILGQLATAHVGASARQALQSSFALWNAAIATLARDSGMAEADAHAFAEDWLAWLQGALVLQAASGSTSAFQRALKALHDLAARSSGEAKHSRKPAHTGSQKTKGLPSRK